MKPRFGRFFGMPTDPFRRETRESPILFCDLVQEYGDETTFWTLFWDAN